MYFELATGKDLAPVDVHWMVFAKVTFNLLQRLLVPRMNRFIGQQGDIGYLLGLGSHLQSEQSLSLRFHSEEDKIALPRYGQHAERRLGN